MLRATAVSTGHYDRVKPRRKRFSSMLQGYCKSAPIWCSCISSCLTLILFMTTLLIVRQAIVQPPCKKCQGSPQNLTEITRLHAKFFADEFASQQVQGACLRRIGNASLAVLPTHSSDILFISRQSEIRLNATGI